MLISGRLFHSFGAADWNGWVTSAGRHRVGWYQLHMIKDLISLKWYYLYISCQLLSNSSGCVRLIVFWNQGTRKCLVANLFYRAFWPSKRYSYRDILFQADFLFLQSNERQIKDFKSHFGIRCNRTRPWQVVLAYIYSLSPAIPDKTIKTTVRNTIRNLTVTEYFIKNLLVKAQFDRLLIWRLR